MPAANDLAISVRPVASAAAPRGRRPATPRSRARAPRGRRESGPPRDSYAPSEASRCFSSESIWPRRRPPGASLREPAAGLRRAGRAARRPRAATRRALRSVGSAAALGADHGEQPASACGCSSRPGAPPARPRRLDSRRLAAGCGPGRRRPRHRAARRTFCLACALPRAVPPAQRLPVVRGQSAKRTVSPMVRDRVRISTTLPSVFDIFSAPKSTMPLCSQ